VRIVIGGGVAGTLEHVHPVTRETTVQPVRYRARAWWAGRLVADSTAAVRVSEPGRPPELYFPPQDVELGLAPDGGAPISSPGRGTGRRWTLPGRSAVSADDWYEAAADGDGDGLVDGRDAAWSWTEPGPGLERLAGLVGFDHDRVRVELLDGVAGDDARDVTVKRFPTWGDARDLVAVLDVRADGERHWVGGNLADHRRPVAEGSQLLGQAVVAAMRHLPGRRVVSGHMVFSRPVDAREPVDIDLTELSTGRTFAGLLARVGQGGTTRATGTLLLDATAPDLVRHQAPAPPCAGPYDSEPYDMSVTGRDLRVAGAAYTNDPAAPAGPPVIDAWVRYRDVPDDPALHAGLLAHFTGHLSIAAALRPHEGVGQAQAHRTLSMGVNAIGIAFHAGVRADRWLHYHHHSTFAGDGMTHSVGTVHTDEGALVASFTVDAMVRGFAGGRPGAKADDRSVM
jgi:acyl-CoA thioesterase II